MNQVPRSRLVSLQGFINLVLYFNFTVVSDYPMTSYLLSYPNQATQVMVVDVPSLSAIRHFPGVGKIASCLREIVSLAVLSKTPLIPSMSLILALPDHIQTLLPVTPVNSSTAKAITTSLLKLDEFLNGMNKEKNLTISNNSSLPAAFSRALEIVKQSNIEVQ